ncbi:FAD-dependent oxidoreductase [Nocardia sp. NBC_01730]|nr:FAD-dependent oxidoreductase [Nocardia sp. NBC_01730]
MTENTDVVVIGGGYAGVMAANRLTQRDDVRVTLINPRPSFVERIRLHQLVGGSDDAVVDYREVLGEDIRLVVDTVTRIDAAERSVTLATGGTVGYDYLVYAVGSGAADPHVPGAAEFAYPIATRSSCARASSSTWPPRHAGRVRTACTASREVPSAGSCSRPSAARRWPPAERAAWATSVDCARTWTPMSCAP